MWHLHPHKQTWLGKAEAHSSETSAQWPVECLAGFAVLSSVVLLSQLDLCDVLNIFL